MKLSPNKNRFILTALLSASVVGSAMAQPLPGEGKEVAFWLTLLHNNDGESKLRNTGAGEEFGGVDRFVAQVRKLRLEAKTPNPEGLPQATLLLSSGDNFLAGPDFAVSFGDPRYLDSIALSLAKYDAICLGNHDFDFGPRVLAKFIQGVGPKSTRFLSCNLRFGNEPKLLDLVRKNRIASSVVLTKAGQEIGIIGATTPLLATISSPRNVEVQQNVRRQIQRQVDKMLSNGVKKIILISHLQSIEEDKALIASLKGIDIAIAGGGDELLANEGDLLLPGDIAVDTYPVVVADSRGRNIPVVTTAGNYGYVGKLVVGFTASGEIAMIDTEKSGPVRVIGGDNPDAIEPAADVKTKVVDVATAGVAELAANKIARTSVELDGQRTNVRTIETNLGNLITDAFLAQARLLAPKFNAPRADVAIQNGGGIRNDSLLPKGTLSELNTLEILPFSNFLCVVPNVTPQRFKNLLENAVSNVANIDGRFAQISGFRYTYDLDGIAQVTSIEGNITTPGTRVVDVQLDNGTFIIQNGEIVPGAPSINLATIDFLARGGDQYPLLGLPFTTLGISYQQALLRFIKDKRLTDQDYPVGGEGRVTSL